LGQCSYASPCIIGTLIPEHRRDEFDNFNDELRTPDGYMMDSQPIISELVAQDLVAFADQTQVVLATTLQAAFDNPERGAKSFAAALEELNQALGLNLKVPADA
jgi:hypothetical protein